MSSLLLLPSFTLWHPSTCIHFDRSTKKEEKKKGKNKKCHEGKRGRLWLPDSPLTRSPAHSRSLTLAAPHAASSNTTHASRPAWPRPGTRREASGTTISPPPPAGGEWEAHGRIPRRERRVAAGIDGMLLANYSMRIVCLYFASKNAVDQADTSSRGGHKLRFGFVHDAYYIAWSRGGGGYDVVDRWC